MAAAVSIARALWVDPMLGQVEGYRKVLKEFAADAIIVDMLALGVRAISELEGLLYITVGHNPRVTFDHANLSAAWKADDGVGQVDAWGSREFNEKFKPFVDVSRAQLGLDPMPEKFRLLDVMTSPYLHLMQTTAAFELADKVQESHLRFVGPMKPVSTGEFQPPRWWPDIVSRDRFVVHVTQGTYTSESMNIESLILPTIRALQHEDCLVVVTSPLGASAFSAESLPPNVRIESFIPHSNLLPLVDIFVTNAGYNGVTTALRHGVPMICAGNTEDKADVSRLVAYCDAGIDMKTNRPAEDQIRDAVKTIRQNPKYTKQARKIQRDFASHDSAVEACDHVESHVKHKQGRIPLFVN